MESIVNDAIELILDLLSSFFEEKEEKIDFQLSYYGQTKGGFVTQEDKLNERIILKFKVPGGDHLIENLTFPDVTKHKLRYEIPVCESVDEEPILYVTAKDLLSEEMKNKIIKWGKQ